MRLKQFPVQRKMCRRRYRHLDQGAEPFVRQAKGLRWANARVLFAVCLVFAASLVLGSASAADDPPATGNPSASGERSPGAKQENGNARTETVAEKSDSTAAEQTGNASQSANRRDYRCYDHAADEPAKADAGDVEPEQEQTDDVTHAADPGARKTDKVAAQAGAAKRDETETAEKGETQTDANAKARQQPDQRNAPVQPYELVRTLELAQDRIAAGSRDAHVGQRKLIGEIEKKLLSASNSVWQEPKNTRAAIIYVLSGGNPGILEKLLKLGPLPCVNDTLLEGLLAYSRGLNDAAKSRLKDVDPRHLDPRIAAHLALAQAMLISGEEPNKAIYYLDLVRLLAPGTLLEEAALRRETVITALIEDFGKFEMLSSQYLRRFGKAVYAREFLSRFAVAVSTSRYSQDADLFQGLTAMLDSLSAKQRRPAYLALTQAAIVRGEITLTRISAGKLLEMAEKNPELRLQAELYKAAAELVTDRYKEAAAALRAIDRRELSARDRPLLDAALNLAVRLRMPPQVEGPIENPPPVSAEQGEPVEFGVTDQVIEQANTTMGQADDLLSGDEQ